MVFQRHLQPTHRQLNASNIRLNRRNPSRHITQILLGTVDSINCHTVTVHQHLELPYIVRYLLQLTLDLTGRSVCDNTRRLPSELSHRCRTLLSTKLRLLLEHQVALDAFYMPLHALHFVGHSLHLAQHLGSGSWQHHPHLRDLFSQKRKSAPVHASSLLPRLQLSHLIAERRKLLIDPGDIVVALLNQCLNSDTDLRQYVAKPCNISRCDRRRWRSRGGNVRGLRRWLAFSVNDRPCPGHFLQSCKKLLADTLFQC
mmetsp:Transcript_46651/g.101383  ORF Transcript_46651/g.101383 Transcript_46651/m.101383 type:complete len:257 (-) Transcript_46651:94-864(-)